MGKINLSEYLLRIRIRRNLYKCLLTYLSMKSISVSFEDKEYEKLLKKKNKLSWHDFIMKLVGDEDGKNN